MASIKSPRLRRFEITVICFYKSIFPDAKRGFKRPSLALIGAGKDREGPETRPDTVVRVEVCESEGRLIVERPVESCSMRT